MKTIFCNWTAPYFYKENPPKEYFLPDYEILIQELAVRSAKKYIGKTKLYTDKVGYDFYEKNNLLNLWDEVDYELLENFTQKNVGLKPNKFWTSGKAIVMGKEPIPYLFLDLDFVIKDKLPSWTKNYDLIHTHWELMRNDIIISEKSIDEIGGISDFVENMLIPNTSFILMNNELLRNEYLKKHYELINRFYENSPDWMWLLADSCIMGYSARKLNCRVETLENYIYIPHHETPNRKPKKCGKGLAWLKDPDRKDHVENLNYYHMWLERKKFENDKDFKENKMKILSDELEKLKTE